MSISRTLTALVGVSLLLACSSRGNEPEPAPSVDRASERATTTGQVVGFAQGPGVHAWLGIPFARPPQGELRWRAPVPPEPWSGVRESLVAQPACAQRSNPLADDPEAEEGTVSGSEDCLYLNVYAPRASAEQAAKRRLPVMLWIHGGGNRTGYAADYDGGPLAARHDVVVVTTAYRLGPFGWLRHPALVAGETDPAERSGNWGTLDQIRALEWVRDNIAAFGGDPANVTIFGESAGGTDVFMLLASPLARGLFHRAISQSGGTRTVSVAEAQNLIDDPEPGDAGSSGELALALLGAPGEDRAAARTRVAAMPPEDQARQLRAASAEQILDAYAELARRSPEPGRASPVGDVQVPMLLRDGHVIPEEGVPSALEAGRYSQVPVLLGSNRDEMRLFLMLDPQYTRWLLGILPRARDPERYRAVALHESRGWKVRGVDRPAATMRALQGPNVYAYRFDWDESPRVGWLGLDMPELLGAFHGLELPFLFPDFGVGPMRRLFTDDNREGREQLSRAMMSYWAEFAYTGDPGRGRDGTLPAWQAWDPAPGSGKFMVLDTEAGGGLRMDPEGLTEAQVVRELLADPVLGDAERCTVLASLRTRGTLLAAVPGASCPLDVAAGAD